MLLKLSAAGLSFETASVALLLQGGNGLGVLSGYLLLHLASSALFALAIAQVAPPQYRRPRTALLLYLFFFNFFIPIGGGLCAVVALLVDTSFSMVMENRWLPMKRTALALHHLVSTRFRADTLEIIAFGRYARTVSAAELIGLEGAYEQGTNLHHALALAGRHLRRQDRKSVV